MFEVAIIYDQHMNIDCVFQGMHVTIPNFMDTALTHWGRDKMNDISRHFKWIFVNENIWIPIKIWLKFVSKGSINNIPALVQIMAWGRPGHKPLSEPMTVNLPTHICITRPQWVKVCINIYGVTSIHLYSWKEYDIAVTFKQLGMFSKWDLFPTVFLWM